jgi:CO/xanthine dehydrogenase FAD-binding subunit
MLRRMFYLLADEAQGSALVADLGSAGIGREHLHAVTGGGRLLRQFPPATPRQQRDGVWRLQGRLWAGNLALFALAALGLALALYTGHTLAALAAAAAMVAAVAAGAVFVYHMPETHLGELNIALRHGDIVLMVDVPKRRANEIAQLVRRRHPEAEANGVGWTIHALGL